MSRAWNNDKKIIVRIKALKRKWFLVHLGSWIEFTERKSKCLWKYQKVTGGVFIKRAAYKIFATQ